MLSKDFLSHIENHYAKGLPFVAYRKPNSVVVKALLQNTSDLYTTEDFKSSGFVFAPFVGSKDTILIPSEKSENIVCEIEILQKKNSIYNNIEANTNNKETYLRLVQKAIDTINEEHLQKVVLSRCETVNLTSTQPISIFKKLLQNYSDAFIYCWYHPKIGLWLGATPETLISVKGNRFKTMALAGTQVYKDSLDVVWPNKEKQEQQFVTDDINRNLKPLVSSLSISDAKTVKAGSLLHLKSNISGILNTELQTVLKQLHPTPAVCGLPVNEAKSFIQVNESYNREYYTGFLGELNLKEAKSRNTNRRNVENSAYASVKTVSHLYVNLRCMQIRNQQAHIYVGGGITKDSNPQHEWEETVSKAETMKRVLVS